MGGGGQWGSRGGRDKDRGGAHLSQLLAVALTCRDSASSQQRALEPPQTPAGGVGPMA